jgi:hypothetical protein
MPVALLMHGRKKEKVHARFFDFVSSVFPKLNRKYIPFVTDRITHFPQCFNISFSSFWKYDTVGLDHLLVSIVFFSVYSFSLLHLSNSLMSNSFARDDIISESAA